MSGLGDIDTTQSLMLTARLERCSIHDEGISAEEDMPHRTVHIPNDVLD